MAEPTPEQIEAAAEAAVSAFVAQLGSHLLTGRWVVIAETINTDGKRDLLMATAPQQTSWDSLGLLNFAAGLELDDAE